MASKLPVVPGYHRLFSGVAGVIAAGRREAAWSLNAVMSAVYWDIGRQIVEFEQMGSKKADYGERVIDLLSVDLRARFGRGFRRSNLFQIRAFYLAYRDIFQTPAGRLGKGKVQTVSGQLFKPTARRKVQTLSGQLLPQGKSREHLAALIPAFTLPWSHYAWLLSLKSDAARRFYETEALRGGWSFRQLDRQISSQLYERLGLSKNKAIVLTKAGKPRVEERSSAAEELRDPYVLEFLNLKDEYSESDLEGALIGHLEQFLGELGSHFCFVGRQRRLRIGGEWYRVDLLYRLVLPNEAHLAAEIGKTRRLIERRRPTHPKFQTLSGQSARR